MDERRVREMRAPPTAFVMTAIVRAASDRRRVGEFEVPSPDARTPSSVSVSSRVRPQRGFGMPCPKKDLLQSTL